MKFEIKRPCSHCPFRRDVAPFLHPKRAADLRDQMRDDSRWFACHETTGVKKGKRIRRDDQSHCAGLMGVLWREGRPNVAMRIALTLRLIKRADLARKQPVFEDLDEFAEHHGKGRIA